MKSLCFSKVGVFFALLVGALFLQSFTCVAYGASQNDTALYADAGFVDVQSASLNDYEIDAETIEEATSKWCLYAQRILENLSSSTINESTTVNTIYTIKDQFVESKPKVQNGKIYISTYVPPMSEISSKYEQIWCKINSQNIITGRCGTYRHGSLMNEIAIQWALSYVPAEVRDAYLQSNTAITQTLKNNPLGGSTWVNAQFAINEKGPYQYEFVTPYFRTTWYLWISAIENKHYFKIISPQGAVDFVTDIANRYLAE